MNSKITNIFLFIGGVGMFLYGMNLMSDGLQKRAGNKLKSLLAIVTKNKLMSILVGTMITAIIQSSSATTVMIVGFVNSGLISLTQATGFIFGANIGTTVTAWLVSMSEWGAFFKPEVVAPLILGIGVFFVIFVKSKQKRDTGEILVGFGLLFIGLSFMSGAMKPLVKNPVVADILTSFSQHPILGLICGVLLTAIIQSSSASIGILQTLAINGSIGARAAVFITLGQNIGTCVTALLSSAGANKMAKRAAIIHLLFNTIGALLFAVIFYILFIFYPEKIFYKINSVEISVLHTIFNISNTLLLLPFANYLVKLSEKIIKITSDEEIDEDNVSLCKSRLDKRLLVSPLSALDTVKSEIIHLSNVVEKNYKRCINSVSTKKEATVLKIFEKEKDINEMTGLITSYLIEISNLSLSEEEQKNVDDMLYMVSDLERIADHCENIAESVKYMIDSECEFSKYAIHDIEVLQALTFTAYSCSIETFKDDDVDYSTKVIESEAQVDLLEKEFRQAHLDRMFKGECNPKSGIMFLDIMSNLERISDHSLNIVEYFH